MAYHQIAQACRKVPGYPHDVLHIYQLSGGHLSREKWLGVQSCPLDLSRTVAEQLGPLFDLSAE